MFIGPCIIVIVEEAAGWSTRVVLQPDTTLAEPHPNSNTRQSKNNTANVVVQQ